MGKIAITGANGMLGRHMTALLTNKGIDCLAVTRKEWDLTEWKTFDELDSIFSGAEVVFHFGARIPQVATNASNVETLVVFDANVRSCLNLAEWACLRKVALVFISSSTVYENPHSEEEIDEEHPKVVNGFGGFYAYSKWLAEQAIQHYVKQGLKSIIIRPSSIYGYGLDSTKLIQHFLDLASSNEKIKIDQPFNRVNLIHSLDVAKATILAYQVQAWGVYNIGGATSPTIAEIAEAAVKICGAGKVELGNNNTNTFLRFNLNIDKAVKAFSFSPSVSLEQGLMLMKQKRVI